MVFSLLMKPTFVADFYQQLYTSFHSESSNQFLFEVEQFIPNISEDNYAVCEGEITVEEMDSLITKTKFNKSPGPDCHGTHGDPGTRRRGL